MTKSKWPSNLTIIRHALSEQNVLLDLLDENLEEKIKALQNKRDADIELAKNGFFQAEQTGKYLATKDPFDICFSSPYKRTVQTAETILAQLPYSIKLFKDNRLREKEFGRLHGLTTEEIKQKYPEEYLDRERDGKYWYRLPRGENYPDVEMRVHSFLDKLHREYNDKRVLIVTHQVPYLLFRGLFEHLGENVLNLGNVPNCGIEEFVLTKTDEHKERMRLKEYNFIAYKKN